MFTLAHISDPHIGPLPRVRAVDLMSKRIIGYINWQRRVRSFKPEILADLVAAMHHCKPDHIAVTGDLVNIALKAEVALARAWLDALGSPDRVTVIPGNHDAYVPGASGKARDAWLPFMSGDAEHELHYPFLRRRGNLAIIGTSTARASAPFMATGHMSDRQLGELAALLKRTGAEGLFRVVLIHNPPHPDSTHWHKRLVGASRFRAAIRGAGAELVLHGHNHEGSINSIAGPSGSVPVIGVPSASNAPGGRRHPAAAFNLYRIEKHGNAYRCHMSEYGFTQPGHPVRMIHERWLSERDG